MRRRMSGVIVCFAAILSVPITGLGAQEVGDFYRGKTIRLMVGGVAGGSYDIAARAFATHMGRHISGNPTFVVDNVYGAGSLIMTNNLYNQAARDGTAIGLPNNNMVLEPALKILSAAGGHVQFDPSRFSYIGTPVQEPPIVFVTPRHTVKTFQDAQQTKVIMGSTGAGTNTYTVPMLVNQELGTKFEMITGYKGPPDVMLAVDRGEVEGLSTVTSTVLGNRPDWFSGKAVPILQFGSQRLPHLPNVPTAIEMSQTEETREVFRFVAFKFTLARLFTLPPDVPPQRVQALRAAFDAMVKDPHFLADAKKLNLDINPINGEEATRMVQLLSKMPASIVEKLRPVLAAN